MTRPSFLLAQLSDPHIGADWFDDQSVPRLEAVLDAIHALRPQPDALIVTGDIADHAADEEYEQVRKLLGPHAALVLPGNHDDRRALYRHFGVGRYGHPVSYAVDFGPLRVLVLDTTLPGEDSGALEGDQLLWLDATLATEPDLPTLIAMHHPPIVTGVPACDEIGLAASDCRALGEVIERHEQVRRIACGHFHSTIAGELAGRGVLVAPSTYVQARLDFQAKEIELTSEHPGFAVHALVDGELISHVETVRS